MEASDARERRFTLEGRFSAVMEMVRKDAIAGWVGGGRRRDFSGSRRNLGSVYTQQCLGKKALPRNSRVSTMDRSLMFNFVS
jgi:hypothetical protein